jgi:hypothetical protein
MFIDAHSEPLNLRNNWSFSTIGVSSMFNFLELFLIFFSDFYSVFASDLNSAFFSTFFDSFS